MNLLEKLKGVFRKMIKPSTIESALKLTPTISPKMKNALELWELMYKDESPWIVGESNVKSLGLASMIAAEKARMATIEMNIKITGGNVRAEFLKTNFEKLLTEVRKQLEYGIAFGGLVIKPYPVLGVDGKYTLAFNFTKATDFYPLSFSSEGVITEAAFIDRIITKDAVYSKLEYHKLSGTNLAVYNKAYKALNQGGQVISVSDNELGTPIPLTDVAEWSELESEAIIEDINTLLFAYFKMPEANTVDLDSPLGASGYARAVNLIQSADEQYSNLLWEFEGGQLAVDVDRTALNPIKDSTGRAIDVLPKLQDRLFRRNLDLGSDETYNVFSPTLRDSSIINGLNNILMHIEDVTALSRGTLSFVNYSEARTATELKILKQRTYAANMDIQKELQSTLKSVLYIMDKYCDLYEIVGSGSYEVAYCWDDSIIVDKDAERQIDLLDINAGLLSKIEYRMKWKGETEEQAMAALKLIQQEALERMKLQQDFVANTTLTTEAAASQDKLQRANESNETTKTKSTTKDKT